MTYWDGQRWVEEAPRRSQPPERLARLRDTVATLIIVAGLVGSATLIAPVDAGTPTIWTVPNAAGVGSVVTAYGKGFPARAPVQLLWDESSAAMPTARTSAGGQFTALFVVPQAALGAHSITAASSSGATRKSNVSSAARRSTVAATFMVLDALATPDPTATPLPDPTALPPTAGPTTSPTDPPVVTPPPTQSPTDPPADPTARPTPRPTPDPTPRPTPRPTPDPTDPPSSGIPAMPGGDLLRKSFADGTFAPFRPITYPNEHPADAMSYACDYKTGTGVMSIHNGYLDVRAKPGTGNRWDCGFLSTGMDGNGHGATFSFTYGYLQFAARLNEGYATWQDPLWLSNSVSCWCAAEIDAAEVIDGRLTFNIHGPANLQIASHSVPANMDTTWHIFGIAKASDHVTFTMDGNVLGTWHGSMPDPMALLIDSKVGFKWDGVYPNAQTPVPTYAHLAWVTVSSHIPSGL